MNEEIFSSATEHAKELEHSYSSDSEGVRMFVNVNVVARVKQQAAAQSHHEERYGEDTLISLVAEWNSLEVQYLLSRFIIS